MLRVLDEAEFDKYVDFAYDLALDLTKSSYPTYTDGIKTKEDFVQRARSSFRKDSEEILLFEVDENVEGWIHYYVLKEDAYVSFCAFNINTNAAQAVEEFIAYISEKYSGCVLYFGLPAENVDVVSHLEKIGFKKEDENYVDVMFFENYQYLPEATEIVKVTRDNFAEFAEIHKVHDDDMYWNNERILKAFDEWEMYLLYEEEQVIGAILYCFIENLMMEIFSVDFKDNQYDAAIFKTLLIKALNEGKKSGISSLTFFNEDDGHSVVQELGFTHISKYVLYTKEV